MTALTEFTHPPLDEETQAISGVYAFTCEKCVTWQDRQLLYFIGHALFDTSCCGSGGCGYAWVPGFIMNWKFKEAQNNRPISLVEPIRDLSLQDRIRDMIIEQEHVTQVNFL